MKLNRLYLSSVQRGGIDIRFTVEQTHLTEEEMGSIIRSFGYTSAIVTLRNDTTAEQIVDCLAENRIYEKAVIAINKIDIATEEDLQRATKSLPSDWPIMRISAFKDIGLEELKDFIYDNLGFMRVYLKPQGQEADLEEPLIVKDDSTVQNICAKLHRDFVRKFRYARVKGPSAKFGLAKGRVRSFAQRWRFVNDSSKTLIPDSHIHFCVFTGVYFWIPSRSPDKINMNAIKSFCG